MGKFKFKLTDISMAQYLLLDAETKDLLEFTIRESLNANSILKIKTFTGLKKIDPKQNNLWNLTWSDIIELRNAINNQNIYDALRLIYEIKENQFSKLLVCNVFAVFKWIVDQLKEIANLEEQELGNEMSQDEKDAGAERLQQFGYTVALDSLAKGNILDYDKYLLKPYSKIFRKMCLNKTVNDINKQYQQNASRKTQGNS